MQKWNSQMIDLLWCKDEKCELYNLMPAYYTPFTLGHGNHVSGHRCRTSAKRDWRETTQGDGVLKRDCRGCRARFLNCQKFYRGSHSADEERSKTGWT